uniref:Os02g0607100 protein n=1 Tax=Macrostomum lignano TaxID=282301 RepID=A0A1I8ING5_9PLAT
FPILHFLVNKAQPKVHGGGALSAPASATAAAASESADRPAAAARGGLGVWGSARSRSAAGRWHSGSGRLHGPAPPEQRAAFSAGQRVHAALHRDLPAGPHQHASQAEGRHPAARLRGRLAVCRSGRRLRRVLCGVAGGALR